MNTRASRCAIWRLHAPPSRYERIQPQAKERTAKLPPNRVTFLNGPNRDFPKWRRQHPARFEKSIEGSNGVYLRLYVSTSLRLLIVALVAHRACQSAM